MNIGFMINDDSLIHHGILLSKSILKDNEVNLYILVPSTINIKKIENSFNDLRINVIVYDFLEELILFPFADKVFAAAYAESIVDGELLWIDVDSIFLKDTSLIELKRGKELAFRPVDKKLIGNALDKKLSDFWKELYNYFDLEKSSFFVETGIDKFKILPYFNAGFVLLKTGNNIFKMWKDAFLDLYNIDQMKEFYNQDYLYKVFIHQAILTCVILKNLEYEKLQLLSSNINFPIHLYDEYKKDCDADNLICIRYDTYFNNPVKTQKFILSKDIEELVDIEKLSMRWLYK
ncbi:hypothetical protein RJG79_12225 [Mycoplasmatota bacterium WC44]